MLKNTLLALVLGVVGVRGAAVAVAGAAEVVGAGSGGEGIAELSEPTKDEAYRAYREAINRLTGAEFKEIVDCFTVFHPLFDREFSEPEKFRYDIVDGLLDFNLKIIAYMDEIDNLDRERVRLSYSIHYRTDGGSKDVESDPRIKSIRETRNSVARNFENFKQTVNNSVCERFLNIGTLKRSMHLLFHCYIEGFSLRNGLGTKILRINDKFKDLLDLKKNLDRLSQSSSSGA